MRYVGIGLVHGYRFTLGRLVPAGTCKYHPSCSQYALDALTLHGARRGTWLAVRRVGRCHPWHDGGLDPVPEPNVRSHSHRAVAVATEES